jgi:2-phosphosulfolactate phosphatase
MTHLEVLFSPADFGTLRQRDLQNSVCVVFDVLRATSSMVTALAHGAEGILPVEEISEALSIRKQQPNVLLAGERGGVRIQAELTGSVAFDLGNSPREFTAERVGRRTIVMTTTNGTRALRACANASAVLAASFLNLGATASFVMNSRPADLVLVCSGTYEEAAYEDVLGAGALCDLLWSQYGSGIVADSAHIARRLFRLEQPDLFAAVAQSRNGCRLLSHPELREDVAFCLQLDKFPLVAEVNREGLVKQRRDV